MIGGFAPCSKAGAAEARTAQSRKHALLAQDTEPRGWTRTVLLPRGTSKPDRDREPESGLKNKPNRLSPLYAQIPQRDNHPGHVKGSMVLTRTARKPELGSSITANRPVTIDLPPLEFSGPRPPVRKLIGFDYYQVPSKSRVSESTPYFQCKYLQIS